MNVLNRFRFSRAKKLLLIFRWSDARTVPPLLSSDRNPILFVPTFYNITARFVNKIIFLPTYKTSLTMLLLLLSFICLCYCVIFASFEVGLLSEFGKNRALKCFSLMLRQKERRFHLYRLSSTNLRTFFLILCQ